MNWIRATFALGAVVVLAGCDGGGQPAARRAGARGPAANESAYHAAPLVDGVAREAGRVTLDGRAQPGAAVRLATPEGRAIEVIAGRDGRWRISLPPSPEMRLFGLSMIDGGRAVQSEGYLAVASDVVAELRAGAGARVLGAVAQGPAVTAVDYDSKGGCVISGIAASGGAARVRIDGADRGAARADASGRFSLALDEPIAASPHSLELVEGERRVTATIDANPAGAMPAIPLRAVREGAGWRVDWTTPGGGVQTTLLFPTGGPA